MRELVERYGDVTVRAGIDAVLDYAEAQARTIIEAIPDGSYAFHDYMEGHVAQLGALRIGLTALLFEEPRPKHP